MRRIFYVRGSKKMLIEQLGNDQDFGRDMLKAAGIKTIDPLASQGIPLVVMMLFNHGHPVWPVYSYLEAEDGTVMLMWPYKIKEPRVFQSTLKKALPIIAKTKHCGLLGIRAVVRPDDKKIYGVSWMVSQSEDLMRMVGQFCGANPKDVAAFTHEPFADPMFLMSIMKFTFAGHMIDILGKYNSFLRLLRLSGYEVPVTRVDRRGRSRQAAVSSDSKPAHSRRS